VKTDKILKYTVIGTAAAVILMMAAATVIERLYGTDRALSIAYHNPIFIVLWAVAAISGVWQLIRRGTIRKPATFFLHISFVLILAGALITMLTGKSGMMELRRGLVTSQWSSEKGFRQNLPFSLQLKEFNIEYYPGSNDPSDYISKVVLKDSRNDTETEYTISMNNILKYDGYRFYQSSYDDDLRGSVLAVSHDPWGVGVTYTGYILLLISLAGFFFQKNSGFRTALKARGQGFSKPVRTVMLVLNIILLGYLTYVIGRNWYRSGHGPFVGTYSVMMLMAWLVTVAMIMLRRRMPVIQPLGFVLAGFSILVASISHTGPEGNLVPVLRSPLLGVHVLCMMVSYTLLGLTALIGVVGLIKRDSNAQTMLRDVSLTILYPAVFILTIGTFIGAVWANISWGSYWSWDPKETWALITMLVYSAMLHSSVMSRFNRPRFFHTYAILAILTVLITYFGVNLLLGGMHSYA
jgi:ABC-type transport system involved in cytochrome c biogenesis permease subunit